MANTPEAANLFRIVYCSRNAIPSHSRGEELDQILATARRNNHDVNVTGALLHTDGMFAQTLEGEFSAVQSIFEQIQADPRHDGLVVLQAESVGERVFGTWAMAHAEPLDPVSARNTLRAAFAEAGVESADRLVSLLDQVVRGVPA